MSQVLLVDVQDEQTLVTVVEDEELVEVYVERKHNKRIVGNIYLGVVANVLRGMQAAFIDIGLEKNAFLYVEDIAVKTKNICDVVKRGQVLLVQVTKEPVSTKGPRVTANITIPGRYTVLMPSENYIGISRRIEGETERGRLKQAAKEIKPDNMGIIIRTVAAEVSAANLQKDLKGLINVWKGVKRKIKKAKPPCVIYSDLGLAQRIVRDLLNDDVHKVVVNSAEVKEQIEETIAMISPDKSYQIHYEQGDILDHYSVVHQLRQAFNKKVSLNSGAYIVIDQTEALTAIDVNTGKYIGKRNLETTVLNTNLQATAEIARQLRIRNIGGIVIIDFIDMGKTKHQKLVLATLEKALKKDKMKTLIMGITNLGLVEMTRKKARMGLDSLMLSDCPYCQGRGKLLSVETMVLQTKKEVIHKAQRTEQPALLVRANPIVAAQIIGSNGNSLRRLEKATKKRIYVKGDDSFHIENVEIQCVSEKDLKSAAPVKQNDILTVKIEEKRKGDGNDGIARIDGYIINIAGGASLVDEKVCVRITKAYKTYANGELVN
jgi:ribonuclease G